MHNCSLTSSKGEYVEETLLWEMTEQQKEDFLSTVQSFSLQHTYIQHNIFMK